MFSMCAGMRCSYMVVAHVVHGGLLVRSVVHRVHNGWAVGVALSDRRSAIVLLCMSALSYGRAEECCGDCNGTLGCPHLLQLPEPCNRLDESNKRRMRKTSCYIDYIPRYTTNNSDKFH